MAKNKYQSVFLADVNTNVICIKFWNGVDDCGFDGIVDIGNSILLKNLSFRKQMNSNHDGIRQGFITELTSIEQYPLEFPDAMVLIKFRHSLPKINSMSEYVAKCKLKARK